MNDNVAIAQAAEMGFDADCYLARYPDVAANWDHAPATHYILYGQYEGRIPGCDVSVSPSPVSTSTDATNTTAPTDTTNDASAPTTDNSKKYLWLLLAAGLAYYAHKKKLI